MRSASDNCLDSTSFPNCWPTNSTTGSSSMNAAEAISMKCKKRVKRSYRLNVLSSGNDIYVEWYTNIKGYAHLKCRDAQNSEVDCARSLFNMAVN